LARRDRVAQLVADARRQPPQRGEVLGVHQLLVARLELRDDFFVLVAEPLGLEGAADGDPHVVEVPGLEDESIDEPVVDGPQRDRHVGIGREQEPLRAGAHRPQAVEELEPGELGHPLVCDDEVDVVLPRDREALHGRGGRMDLDVRFGLEDALRQVQRERLIVHHQHAVRGFRHRGKLPEH
jgi:hypothetical protein